ncbi:MAG: hypothetical protein HQM10_01285 [Candidatus Riflebacteria bacterium]|nr:hypothetical protein [Candidatus Riflebacteria bacterium]
MEKERISDSAGQEDGEEQLSTLIKHAGNEARMRRNKALETHFNKLKKVIAEAVSHQQILAST